MTSAHSTASHRVACWTTNVHPTLLQASTNWSLPSPSPTLHWLGCPGHSLPTMQWNDTRLDVFAAWVWATIISHPHLMPHAGHPWVTVLEKVAHQLEKQSIIRYMLVTNQMFLAVEVLIMQGVFKRKSKSNQLSSWWCWRPSTSSNTCKWTEQQIWIWAIRAVSFYLQAPQGFCGQDQSLLSSSHLPPPSFLIGVRSDCFLKVVSVEISNINDCESNMHIKGTCFYIYKPQSQITGTYCLLCLHLTPSNSLHIDLSMAIKQGHVLRNNTQKSSACSITCANNTDSWAQMTPWPPFHLIFTDGH